MLDDFLLIVMRGSQTPAKQTMLEFGRENLVREFGQQFENEMSSRLVGMAEDLAGRKVLGYQSQILVEPEVVTEIFFFDVPADKPEVEAIARGQLDGPSASEARGRRRRRRRPRRNPSRLTPPPLRLLIRYSRAAPRVGVQRGPAKSARQGAQVPSRAGFGPLHACFRGRSSCCLAGGRSMREL